ncbi:MAG: undecaprenyl-phosphate galactose phosphotransferase WbaP [Thermodesulfovibrionales bacterium]
MHRKRLIRLRAHAEDALIFLIDVMAVKGLLQLSVLIRLNILPHFFSGLPQGEVSDAWWIVPVWVFFFVYEGLYTMRASFWDEIRALWKVAVFATAGVLIIVSIGKLSSEISRIVVLLMGLLSLFCLPAFHMLAKKVLRQMGFLKRRVLILGAGKTGSLILKALKREPNYGYEVIGFVDDDPEKFGTRIDGIKVHRGIDKALAYINRADVADIFIAMPGAGKERLQGIINHLQHKVERILFVPDIFGIAVLGTNLQHFSNEEAFALEMKNNLSNPVNIVIKWLFDIMISLLLLPLLLLIILVIGVLIRLDSPGPIIFSQERVGKKGTTFRCMKFRSMYLDAEERLAHILKTDPAARKEWEEFFKLRDDPRITRMGKFLRTTSLDELPQIFHVLTGTMSLVGPRPVTREEIDMYYKDMAELCFSVSPGITGLWQVTGRSNTSYDYRISLDAWYVRNWNVWLDLVILLKTIRIVIMREGAF